MNSRARTVYVCSACGNGAAKWQGQCPDCGAWNTLSAMSVARAPASRARVPSPAPAPRAAQALGTVEAAETARLATGSGEFDRVLGGGLVPGSVTLLGGDPGIGKSTLLLQAAAARVLIVDSIQAMASEAVEASPGTVSQLRESAARFVTYAKGSGTAVVLIGHVTKEGVIAGPRLLEHLVDTVLYFESDAGSRFRVVRTVKNRFGAANEIGVFAMEEEGLREVANPSAIFLSRHDTAVAGSAVLVTREGSRPLLVEVQALVDEAHAPNPRRIAVGLDGNRLALLLAVLHRHGGIALHAHDVFVNVVGGMRVGETAADLAVTLAAVSSLKNRALSRELVIFGEIGLAGEIRPVPFGEERLREAAKHGFKRAIVPRANVPRRAVAGIEVTGVARLEEALAAMR